MGSPSLLAENKTSDTSYHKDTSTEDVIMNDEVSGVDDLEGLRDDDDSEDEDEGQPLLGVAGYSHIPHVLPLTRYYGHCNVRTVKDGMCAHHPGTVPPSHGT